MASRVHACRDTRTWSALTLVGALALAACGGDGGGQPSFDRVSYCAAAQAVAVPVGGTAASGGTLDERLHEISTRAAAWRALRAMAPKRLEGEHATVADAEVAKVQALAAIKPATLDELNLAAAPITDMLDTRFPERGTALDAVNAFAQSECGLAVTEG